LLIKIGFCNFAPLNQILIFVNHLKDYIIQFVRYELGDHHLEFEVDDSFFGHFEYSQIQHGKIHVDIGFEKQERMMIFTISLTGNVLVTCDRCSDEFYLSLTDNQRLIVKFGTEYFEESEDVVVIPESEYKFDMASYLYEFIHLALPARVIHPDDENGNSTCDPDMLERLRKITPSADVDPRWESLRNFDNEN